MKAFSTFLGAGLEGGVTFSSSFGGAGGVSFFDLTAGFVFGATFSLGAASFGVAAFSTFAFAGAFFLEASFSSFSSLSIYLYLNIYTHNHTHKQRF